MALKDAINLIISTGVWKMYLGMLLILGAIGCVIAIFFVLVKKIDIMDNFKVISRGDIKSYILKNSIIGFALLMIGLLLIFVF